MSLAALTAHDRSRWHAIAAAARPRIETRLFIEGRFVDAYKQSGNARDKCFDSIKSYTQTKSAWFRLSQP